mmetsp:Transcript_4167/g.8698  ORF Transcript_4167/g.8698 Transcript_4167/m.8698 type:complete len:203 (-) Transcript_4167:1500-2108(-)
MSLPLPRHCLLRKCGRGGGRYGNGTTAGIHSRLFLSTFMPAPLGSTSSLGVSLCTEAFSEFDAWPSFEDPLSEPDRSLPSDPLTKAERTRVEFKKFSLEFVTSEIRLDSTQSLLLRFRLLDDVFLWASASAFVFASTLAAFIVPGGVIGRFKWWVEEMWWVDEMWWVEEEEGVFFFFAFEEVTAVLNFLRSLTGAFPEEPLS